MVLNPRYLRHSSTKIYKNLGNGCSPGFGLIIITKVAGITNGHDNAFV